ncbi:SUKH-4 family immunity protein [Embleya sp. NPDC005971]|uniref:SUKH-4 family immunity protein n=1 Tax=Embleya sp. NPDC005971 TaxID=3156724 RepID=UPI0033CEEA0A
MAEVIWLPYDEDRLAAGGVDGGTARFLAEKGLPADCNRMFVRHRGRDLAVRELPPGRAVFLGDFEDGVNSYWLLTDGGEVWMARGYEDGATDQQYGLVNTSVERLAAMLRIWAAFVYSGKGDMDDGYEDWAQAVIDQAQRVDPAVFVDEDSWWSRVFEEVEFGVLAPE